MNRYIALLSVVLWLSACGNNNNPGAGDGGGDRYVNEVVAMAAASPEDSEPHDVEAFVPTSPESVEPQNIL